MLERSIHILDGISTPLRKSAPASARLVFYCGLLCLFAVPQLRADSVHLLPTAPDAVVEGSQTFTGTGVSNPSNPTLYYLNVTVDYAVFQPGSFPSSLDPNPGVYTGKSSFGTNTNFSYQTNRDGSNSQYIYAYQVFNNGDPNNPLDLSVQELSVSFTVNSNPISSVGESNPLNLSSGVAVPYTYWDIVEDATQYQIYDTIAPGQESWLYLYSSAQSPGSASAYIQGGLGTGPTENLFSPVGPAYQINTVTSTPVPLPASKIQMILMLLMLPAIGLVTKTLPKALRKLQGA